MAATTLVTIVLHRRLGGWVWGDPSAVNGVTTVDSTQFAASGTGAMAACNPHEIRGVGPNLPCGIQAPLLFQKLKGGSLGPLPLYRS